MDNLIQIGEARIRLRGDRPHYGRDDRCRHYNLTYDNNGEIVSCDDCGKQVSAFWAMKVIIFHYNKATEAMEARASQLAADKAHNLHLIAAKKVEAVWRGRTMAPCCPHCGRGILAEDGLGGSQTNRKMELARRQRGDGKPGLFRGAEPSVKDGGVSG
jgi:hypothetical protein